jgi:serine/threonine protein kinase
VAQLGHETRRTQTARGHPGTPAYKSPEQANYTGYLDERSDLYSLGLVMYEMLTGRLYVRNYVPPEAYNPKTSPLLSKVIMRTLEEDPRDRYQSAAELHEELLKLQQRGLGNSLRQAAVTLSESPLWRIALPLILIAVALGIVWGGIQLYGRLNANTPRRTPTVVAAAPSATNTLPRPTTVAPTATRAPATATPTRPATPTITPIPSATSPLGDQYEPNDINPSAIAIGETQTHSFNPTGDVDKVAFRAKAGRWYAVSTGNLAIGVDTRLEIWVAGELYENDDAVPGQLASLIQFQSPAEVMVVVTIISLDQFGANKYYDITVMELPPTATPPPTGTPSSTVTPTNTSTWTPTNTPTSTRTPTNTPTWTPTFTVTVTPVPSATFTNTPPPTHTSIPPTNTIAPPTNTSVPPTNTTAPAGTSSPRS